MFLSFNTHQVTKKEKRPTIRRLVGLFALRATSAFRLYHRASPSVGRAFALS